MDYIMSSVKFKNSDERKAGRNPGSPSAASAVSAPSADQPLGKWSPPKTRLNNHDATERASILEKLQRLRLARMAFRQAALSRSLRKSATRKN
jgi:hypothetical protein